MFFKESGIKNLQVVYPHRTGRTARKLNASDGGSIVRYLYRPVRLVKDSEIFTTVRDNTCAIILNQRQTRPISRKQKPKFR